MGLDRVGIPSTSLLETNEFPVEDLAKLALREGQRTKTLYRAHRWFARRLGSQFRALYIGALLPDSTELEFWDVYHQDVKRADGLTVLDPFLGGGTTLVEASRLGADVVGMDIDPVPATIARFHLEASKTPDLEDPLSELQREIGDEIKSYHQTEQDGVEREVLYHFWVQITHCRRCGSEIELHPHYQLARDTDEGIQWAFCRHCHDIQELSIKRDVLVCNECSRRTKIQAGTQREGTIICLDCRAEEPLSDNSRRRDGPPEWRLFAQQYLERYGPGPRQLNRKYKKATQEDKQLYQNAASRFEELRNSGIAKIPDRHIPSEGRSDSRPILHGFTHYHQLFNNRQLLHLHNLADELSSREESPESLALSMAFSEHLTTNCMLVGYAFGYERTSPLFSYHSYRHITRPVEVNPWLHRIGRGTYPNAVLKVQRAVEAARNPEDLLRDGEKRTSDVPVGVEDRISNDLDDAPESSVIAAQSSENLDKIPDDSVDLVVTDPPYGDNINYSELSDFYLCWHQILGIAPKSYEDPSKSAPLQANLAASGRNEDALQPYQEGLEITFKEINRILRSDGMLIFTFHHVDANTWSALAEALTRSGLRITNILPLRGEGQNGLHNHAGTIKWDAVFVCRKGMSKVNTTFSPCLHESELKQARTISDNWRQRLVGQDLGFREPDHLNLLRALLVEASQNSNGDGIPLPQAIQQVEEEDLSQEGI
jgi:adenine-specific DNA methylase